MDENIKPLEKCVKDQGKESSTPTSDLKSSLITDLNSEKKYSKRFKPALPYNANAVNTPFKSPFISTPNYSNSF